MPTAEPAADHVRDLLPAYVARRLASASMDEVEAHLLACDACFAALVALSLSRG